MVSMVIDFHTLFLFFLRISASSAEFVGRFWFWESSQVVIQGNFHGVEGAKAVGSSGNHSDFVVEALNGAIGDFSFGPKPIQYQRLMGAYVPEQWSDSRPLGQSWVYHSCRWPSASVPSECNVVQGQG